MSKVDKSKCSGGWPEIRSSGRISKYSTAQFTKWITFEWVITTPFGVPVDPEVNRMCAAFAAEYERTSGQRNDGPGPGSAPASIHPIRVSRGIVISRRMFAAG